MWATEQANTVPDAGSRKDDPKARDLRMWQRFVALRHGPEHKIVADGHDVQQPMIECAVLDWEKQFKQQQQY